MVHKSYKKLRDNIDAILKKNGISCARESSS
jgi:hypothetical protein